MAVTFPTAKPPVWEGWNEAEHSYRKSLKFYSATGSDTHAVYRFVGPSVHATPATAVGQYSAVSGAGGVVIGALLPQVHDDGVKEHYEAHAVGKQAEIVHLNPVHPIYIEAGAGVTAGEVAYGAEISTDADGKAILTGANLSYRVVAIATEAVAVGGVTYVKCILVPAGRITPAA